MIRFHEEEENTEFIMIKPVRLKKTRQVNVPNEEKIIDIYNGRSRKKEY